MKIPPVRFGPSLIGVAWGILTFFSYHQISDAARPYVDALRCALTAARREARNRLQHVAPPSSQEPGGHRFVLAEALAPHLLSIPGIRGVYVFGSVARGQDREASDIDLFLWRTNTRLPYFRELLLAIPEATWFRNPEWFQYHDQLCQFVLSGRAPSRSTGFDDARALLVPEASAAFQAHTHHPAVWSRGDVWVQPTSARGPVGGQVEVRGIGETVFADRLTPFTWTADTYQDRSTLRVTAKPPALAQHLEDVMTDWPDAWIVEACSRTTRLWDLYDEVEKTAWA